MSFSESSAFAEVIHNLQVESSIVFSMTALLSYEYFLTLSQEVGVMWRRKWTGATWIFILNRYTALGLYIMYCTPGESFFCFTEDVFLYFFSLFQYLVFAMFSALRVYVLWNRNMWWFLVVLILNLMPFGTNLYGAIVNIVTYVPELQTCEGDYGGPLAAAMPLSVSTRLSMIVADILVLVSTWIKTAATYREARRLGIKTPIAKLLLRDGTIYFAILLVLNIYQILADNIPTAVIIEPGSELIPGIASMLISRFMLNLRQVDLTSQSQTTVEQDGTPEDARISPHLSPRHRNGRTGTFSAPRFRIPQSIVGNLGEDLEDSYAYSDAEEMESTGYMDEPGTPMTVREDEEKSGKEHLDIDTSQMEEMQFALHESQGSVNVV